MFCCQSATLHINQTPIKAAEEAEGHKEMSQPLEKTKQNKSIMRLCGEKHPVHSLNPLLPYAAIVC